MFVSSVWIPKCSPILTTKGEIIAGTGKVSEHNNSHDRGQQSVDGK